MKKTVFYIISICMIFIITSFLISCNFGPLGLFKSFEIESQLDDRELSNDLSVGSITKIGGTYYIGAGEVYTRTSTTSWESLEAPEADTLCLELASMESTLYAVYYKIDGSDSKLYYLSGDNKFYPVGDFGGNKVTNIIPVKQDGETKALLASVEEEEYGYALYYKPAGADTFKQSEIENSDNNLFSRKIADGTYFDGLLWMACASELYTSEDDGALFSVVEEGPAITNSSDALYPVRKYSRLYHAPTLEALFVSTENGYVYGYDGATWSNASDELPDAARLYGMSELPVGDDKYPGRTLLVVGSSSGYYEAVFDTVPPTLDDLNAMSFSLPGIDSYSTSENYLNTVLSDSVVLSFLLDYDENGNASLFTCTLIQGLWRNDEESGTRVWNRE